MGLPVVGLDQPALAEAIGQGGLLVPASATPAVWIDAIAGLWDHPDRYAELCERARRHAMRADADPHVIIRQFEHMLESVKR